MRIVSEFVSVCNSECTMKPASLEMRGAGGFASGRVAGWSARFTMVSRGVPLPSLIVVEFDHFKNRLDCG